MKLYCVRHGETVYNLDHRIQGQFDSELSPLGRQQCQAVADVAVRPGVRRGDFQPLEAVGGKRRYIADKLQLEVKFDPRLKEINAGVFQGHRWPELDAALSRGGRPVAHAATPITGFLAANRGAT